LFIVRRSEAELSQETCWSCGGSGVVQRAAGRSYYGVCQECQGAGTLYRIEGREVSQEEHERYLDDDYDDE
jgi:DnaJ-class molecular chaperone